MKIASLEILRLVSELQKFVGKRIDNVYHDESRLFLKISSGNGIEITPKAAFVSSGFSTEPTNFAHILRKHIKGRKILSLEQHNFDRIVVIGLGERVLVTEMFHRGNIVLCDSNMKIIAAANQRQWKDRSIMPKSTYQFPSGVNITDSKEFFQALETDEKIVSFLVRGGLGSHAESVLEACGIEKTKDCRRLLLEERKGIFAEIMSLVKRSHEESETLSISVSKSLKAEEFSVEDKKQAAIDKMKEKENELRTKAKKIYEKFAEISAMIQLTNERHPVIEIDGLKIEIERSISLEKNAKKYFENAKKIRGKMERASKIVLKEKHVAEQTRKEWYQKFRWFFTSEKLLVIAGKDAKTNNDIIKKHLDAGDVVAHAEIHGAAFAVLKCKNNPSKYSVSETMQFAACHSKAWAMGIGAVDVYWVKPNQLKSGLGMGTFNVIGEKNYERRMELKLGVGFIGSELHLLPHKFFEHLGIRCVPVFTGDISAKEVAKRVKEMLKKIYIDKVVEIDGMPLDSISSKIPYGRGSV